MVTMICSFGVSDILIEAGAGSSIWTITSSRADGGLPWSGGSIWLERLLPAALILYSWLKATSTCGILNLLPCELAL